MRTGIHPRITCGAGFRSKTLSRSASLSRNAGGFLKQRLAGGAASGSLDLGVVRKGEGDADRLAFVAQIIEHDALHGRRDFLELERVGRKRFEARPPIGFERGATLADLDPAAPAFERCVV